jgi:hypothetical protein
MTIRRILNLPRKSAGLKLSQPYTGNGCGAVSHKTQWNLFGSSAAPESGIEANTFCRYCLRKLEFRGYLELSAEQNKSPALGRALVFEAKGSSCAAIA